MARTTKTKQLPTTDSIDELARFWDEHDLTDFEDELVEVTEPVFVRGQEPSIRLHLSWQELEQLEEIASDRGVDSPTLVREWVLEMLRAA